MTARLESEWREDVLLVRLMGTIGFDRLDFALHDDLVALLKEHVSGGGTHLLVDFSRTIFVHPSSSMELAAMPFVQKVVLGPMRVAAFFGGNEQTRGLFHITRLERYLDCFESEADALAFLRSGEPMTNGAALRHELWADLGSEVGPERCAREGCDRLHIGLSRLCKHHHYEMVMGVAYAGATDA